MVVVRESPRAKISPDKNSSQWPPRSPFEALMASPSGKKRWEDTRQRADEDRSPSPSPMRRPMIRPMSSSKALQDIAMADQDDEDEAEDEETLQLKLQQIEMKLKLKKLQGKKKSPDTEGSARASSRADSITRSPQKSQFSMSQPLLRRPEIEVPVSPTRERQIPLDPVSPARARLGLSAAAKAQDVSLKRARDGTIKPSISQREPISRMREEAPRPVSSFSERLAKSRQEQQDQQIRNDRIERSRSTGFGLKDKQSSSTPSRAGITSTNIRSQSRTGGERMPSPTKGSSSRPVPQTRRSNDGITSRQSNPFAPSLSSQAERNAPNDGHDHGPPVDESEANIAWNDKQDGNSYDPFSGIHLKKRHIAHVDVARALEGSELYPLPRLLKEVKAPEYDPPDCESDYIVFGVLAKKSNPYNQKATHKTNDANKPQEDATAPRNKFMVMTLVDLKWEVDLFLFGTAFDQFWKLTEGTLLAIQNPSILPPKGNQNNGRFSLKLGSSEDRVMEIGVARDLDYCASVKKDGNKCDAWIDKRSTQVCDFHLNMMIDKNRRGRMEVNTMWRGGSLDDQEKQKRKAHNPANGKKKMPGHFAGEHGRTWSVNTGFGKSAANILDGEDRASVESLTAEEKSRKRIAAAQRERDLARKLENMGGGVGADYLRARQTTTTVTSSQSSQEKTIFEKPSASDLGLLGNKATAIRLSPAKDRKRHFGVGAISSAGSEAMGWGGAKKYGLLQPKTNRLGSPEKGQTTLQAQPLPRSAIRPQSQDGSESPKKRARFALDKGIREPGRESLGTATAGKLAAIDDDDDDDDLDIV